VKSISQIKLWQFATASFNCGQLQTSCSKLGYMDKLLWNFRWGNVGPMEQFWHFCFFWKTGWYIQSQV